MKETDLDVQVQKKLIEFEENVEIHFSTNWNFNLMNSIVNKHSNFKRKSPTSNLTFVLIFVVLFNVGFFLKVSNRNENKYDSKNQVYIVILKEFLITPITNGE
ncbi:MAG: hypothetical protein NTW25_05875 [Candidatus Kapabacteria bacterium]|nr:hypothetical protein [Candidatus Kapabacteria bacterium]